MKRLRGTSTEANLPQGTIHYAGDAAFPASGATDISEATPVRRYGYTGGEVVAVSLPDTTLNPMPVGLFATGTISSIPGTENTLVQVRLHNFTPAPIVVPALDIRYIVFPK